MGPSKRVGNAAPPSAPTATKWLIALALALTAGLVFGRLRQADFFNYDDPEYVYTNPHVLDGLSAAGVRWAFTTFTFANWHPLTWLSLQLDASVYGPRPAGFHTTNIVLHALNSALVFLVLLRLTRARWASAFAAGLFSLHPLHVESVAWIADRKGLLSTFFGLLAMLAYAGYVGRGRAWRYALIVVAFGLSLMAKPMLVTLPFVLLLLDYWPLERWPGQGHAVALRRLLLEKLPLLALSALHSLVTMIAQGQAGAVKSLELVPLANRVANALQAYVDYLWQLVVPIHLAPHYPHQRPGLGDGRTLLSAAVLAGLTVLALAQARRRPYRAVGWLWYLGTLVPAIGLVQAGMQARADRFTYVPLIGIFVALAFEARDRAKRWQLAPVLAAGAAVFMLSACALGSWVQAGYWRNSIVMWRHCLASTAPSTIAWNNLGSALAGAGRWQDAIPCFHAALALDSQDAGTLCNRGTALFHLGQLEAARQDLEASIQLDPSDPEAHTKLGVLLDSQGKRADARRHYEIALERDPSLLHARSCLALGLLADGDLTAAAEQFAETARRHPEAAPGYFGLGTVRMALGQFAEAAASFAEAARIDPNQAMTWYSRAQALGLQGHWQEAAHDSEMALRLAPGSGPMRGHFSFCLDRLGDQRSSQSELALSLRAEPSWPRQLAQGLWRDATQPNVPPGRAAQTVYLAQLCCFATANRKPELLDLLAAARRLNGKRDGSTP